MNRHWKIVRPANGHVDFVEPKYTHSWLGICRGLIQQNQYRVPIISTLVAYFKIRKSLGEYTPLSAKWLVVYLYLHKKGWVEQLWLDVPCQDELPLYYFHLRIGFFSQKTDGVRPPKLNIARGFSLDYDLAVSKCFGECLERFPYIHFSNSWFTKSNTLDLHNKHIHYLDPVSSATLNSEQSGYHDNKIPHQEYMWSLAKQLPSRKEVHVPTQFYYWTFDTKNTPIGRYTEHGTHGGAAYFTTVGAELRALYEIVGRDGFFHHWCFDRTPGQIDINTCTSSTIAEYKKSLQSLGFKVYVFDVTSPIVNVPSIFCLLQYPDTKKYYSGGAGCDINCERAIESSLEEALSMYHNLCLREVDTQQDSLQATQWGDTQRLDYYANQDNSDIFDKWITSEKKPIEIRGSNIDEDESRTHNHIVGLCKNAGVKLYVHHSENTVLDKLHFKSVRIFSPDLIPMYHWLHNIPLASLAKRQKLLQTKYNINYQPHLYP